MLTATRLAWRMQRWEIAVLLGVPLLLAVALGVLALALASVLPALEACWAAADPQPTPECRSLTEWGNLLPDVTTFLAQVTAFMPFAVGILLGAPLVAREIEHRTAPMAWSLSASRVRWLAGRMSLLAIGLAVVLLLLGQASQAAMEAYKPNPLGFFEYGTFGPIVAARGLGIFVLGVAIGLVAGRVLPAILVSALATVALMGGVTYTTSELMRSDAEWRPMDQQELVHMVFDSGFRADGTGEVITYEQAFERFPEALNAMTAPDDAPDGWTPVWRVVPPELYDRYVLRESGAFLALLALSSVAGFVIVRGRRPT